MARITDYRIVISATATSNERRVAQFLRNNVRLVTGKLLPLVEDTARRSAREIVVGKTRREKKGFLPERTRDGLWQYVIKSEEERVFICGLGLPPEPPDHFSSYTYIDEGDIGTAMGVYRFIEDVLGYDFIYEGYAELTEDRTLDAAQTVGAYSRYTFDAYGIREIIYEYDGTEYVISVSSLDHHESFKLVIEVAE